MKSLGSFFILIIIAASLLQCSYTYKIKSGEEAFDVKQYSVAVEMLAEEYASTSNNEDKAYKAMLAGRSYDMMNRPAQASEWYAKAIESGAGLSAMESYALALRRQERYEEAIATYETMLREYGQESQYVAAIAQCRQALIWKKEGKDSPYTIKPVPFNSAGSDYAPFVIGPNELAFTSDRGQIRGEAYKWTGRNFSDIYTGDFDGYGIALFDPQINSRDNEGTVTMNRSRDVIYFSRCYAEGESDAFCKLMVSRNENGRWSDPEVLSFVADGINYGHPALARNDSLLFFSSDNPAGAGGYDIYFSTFSDGDWSEPVSAGPRINTGGNEKFPALHNDTLYFSSDFLPGMGGQDIFKTYPRPGGDWAPPINLKPPINSGWDDFGFIVDTFTQTRGDILQTGFFCSSRTANGDDDIYAFTKRQPAIQPRDTVVTADAEDPQIKYQLFLALRVLEPVFADPNDPNSERTGKRALAGARVYVGEGAEMRNFRTDDYGYLILEAEYDKLYNLQARFRGFLTQSKIFDATKIEKDPAEPVKTINMEIVLEPVFSGIEIVLENIYYDLDKWDIREDAKPSLDELAKILQDNPGIRIQLGSHTDCRADDDYNMELSQKRAQSAVDYLIASGINASRLEAVGYGETQFAVNCPCTQCTEEQHQANRRTTFKVVQ